jgi:hypothetical protein
MNPIGNPQGQNQQPGPAPGRGRPGGGDTIQIGLWGGPFTGKSTFIAALRDAALLQPDGNWIVNSDPYEGVTPDVLSVDHTDSLQNGKFPPRGTSAVHTYSYIISGEMTPGTVARLSQTTGPQSAILSVLQALMGRRLVHFNMRVWDYPGDVFGKLISSPAGEQVREYLATCHGLVYLYDPTRNDNYKHLSVAMEALWGYMFQRQILIENRLPHFAGVCASKFDHPSVFERLVNAGLVERAQHGGPFVPNEKAAFDLLTESDLAIRNTITRRFLPGRVAYFMTSSIGFYRPDRNAPVDQDDYHNFYESADEELIRGPVEPVNVLEPLLWIYESASNALAEGLMVPQHKRQRTAFRP